MEKLFNRVVKIELLSHSNKSMIILDSKNLFFKITIKKYLSHIKDEAIIEIANLNKETMNLLTSRNYDFVKIYAGYGERLNLVTFNSVLSITMDKSDLITPKLFILCSSKYKPRDKRNSLNIVKGTSIYSAIKLAMRYLGVSVIVDERLKNKVLKNDLVTQYGNSVIAQLLRDYDFLSVNYDNLGLGYDLEIKEIYNAQNKIIQINPLNGTLIKDWISFDNNQRISFYSLPVIIYKIGSVVEVDEEFINYSIQSTNKYLEAKKLYNVVKNFKQKNQNKNLFVIIELEYKLNPRDKDFYIKVVGRLYNSFRPNRFGKAAGI